MPVCRCVNFKRKQPVNFLSMVPVRNVHEFTDDEERIVLFVPRFKNEKLRKWFIPKQKSPNYKIHLDEIGSEVWRLIDQRRTVEEICSALISFLEKKNKPSAQIEERVTAFLSGLYKNGIVTFNEA